MNKVSIGASTIAFFIAIVGSVIAFVTAWAESGSAPTWLGLVTAGLVAVMGILRTAQAMQLNNTPADIDLTEVLSDPPAVPTDAPSK
jgi:hypothetical protein